MKARTFKYCATGLCMALLVGCSDSDDNNDNQVAEDDTTEITEEQTELDNETDDETDNDTVDETDDETDNDTIVDVEDNDVITDEDDNDTIIDVEDNDVITDEDDNDTIIDPDDDDTTDLNPGVSNLDGLLGSMQFVYSFTDATDTYAMLGDFLAGNAGIDEDGDAYSAAAVTAYYAGPGESNLSSYGEFVMLCYDVGDGANLLCGSLSDAATDATVYLFPALTSGTSVGIFEYCPEGITDACFNELVSTPDGRLDVRNDSVAPAAKSELSLDDNAAHASSDLSNYLIYSDQASAPRNDELANSDAVQAKSKELTAILKNLKEFELSQ